MLQDTHPPEPPGTVLLWVPKEAQASVTQLCVNEGQCLQPLLGQLSVDFGGSLVEVPWILMELLMVFSIRSLY